MKILVTGGCGFIGSHLVERLLSLGHKVTIVDDLSTGNLKNVKDVLMNPNVRFEQIKIQTLPDAQFIGAHDVVYHLAALPRVQLSVDFPLKTHSANVTGTLAVLEYCKKFKIQRIFYASSSSVYGDGINPLHESMKTNPLNPYALQKYMGELYLKQHCDMYGVDGIAFRFFNVYGERMAEEGSYKLVFMNWLESIRKGEPMKIFGDGKQTRDFTYVGDLVEAITIGRDNGDKGFKVYNIGSGKQTSILELAQLFGYPFEHVQARAFEEREKQADISSIKEDLGWSPKVFLPEGVKRIKEYYAI